MRNKVAMIPTGTLAGILIVVFSMIASPRYLQGYPTRTLDSINVHELFEKSDLVCRGTVVKVSWESESSLDSAGLVNTVIVADIRTNRIYKGTPLGIVRVRYQLLMSRNADRSIPAFLGENTRQLAFLRRSGEEYSFVDQQFGHFSPGLGFVKASASGMELLQADLLQGLRTENRQQLFDSLVLLLGYPKLKSISEVRHVIGLNDPGLSALSYAILLKNNDFSLSEQLRSFVNQFGSAPVLNFDIEPLVSTVAEIRDTSGLPLLTVMSDSNNRDFRRAAVQAMRAVGDKSSVRILVRRLDDPDPWTQLFAVKALAEITGNNDAAHSPSVSEFQRSSSQYVLLWKSWWSEEGKSLYGAQ